MDNDAIIIDAAVFGMVYKDSNDKLS